MKLSESKQLILMSSIILGFLLASQLSIGKFIPGEVLTLQSFQQVSSELREVSDEITILIEQRKKLSSKLLEYQQTGQDVSDTVKKISDELIKYDFDIGFTDVKGPGVIVTLGDNPNYGKAIDTREFSEDWIVHDIDILNVLWELKNAGAEAISINNERITYKTDIYCGGPIIYVNSLEMVPPYNIKAIGDTDTLKFALNRDESYYKWLEARGLDVSIKLDSSIKILKYDKNINYFYMKPVKE